MSGSVSERKRLIRVNQADIAKSEICISGHHDFFQTSHRSASHHTSTQGVSLLEIHAEAIDRPLHLSFSRPGDDPSGNYLSGAGLAEFFSKHGTQAGDVLAFDKTIEGMLRLYVFESKGSRDLNWRRHLEKPLKGSGPTVLELFAGCGGMALGFVRAGFRTALAVEWDAAACESIRANITSRVAQCPIHEIERFPEADVIAGGPPCQGFSNLGERVPDDPRNQLWKQYMRAVEEVRPRAFVMENVPPLLASQEFVEITSLATKLGYGIEGRVLNAANYGVPQTRKRAIIIGIRGGEPSFPEPSHVSPAERNLLSAHCSPWVTVRDAIGDLPSLPTGENWHIGRNPTAMSLERYSHIPPGGNRWDLPLELMPDCWKRKTKGGTDLFGRLWWDRPSVTIRTEFYKPEKGRYLHPEANRPITHREAARLQGFPDSFDFRGKRIQVGIQIGNACPPPLGAAIARHIAGLLQQRGAAKKKSFIPATDSKV